jgi:ABC-2 type transport system permease protein
VRLFRHELRGQMLMYSRSRELAFFTFAFPIILLLLLGSAYGDEEIEGVKGSSYLMTGTLGYGVAATAFAGLAIVLVLRREDGVLKRLRATPLPGKTYMAAVVSTTLFAFLVQAVVVVALTMVVFDASAPKEAPSLVAALVIGALAFAALGIGLSGLIRRAEGASAVVNAIYFPMLFISGSFFSQQTFPSVVEAIANVLPLTYFIDLTGDIALRGHPIWERPFDVAMIVGWGLLGALVAMRRFRWTPTEG